MKAPLIQIKNLHISISTFLPEQVSSAVSFLEPGSFVPAAPATDALTPPAIGEYWPGQGGLYGGLREYPEGLCYVIFAATDVGKHAYGDYGTKVAANCHIDGRANTEILIGRDGKHPAAIAAAAYTADGHHDFYLPSAGELYHAFQYIPESFEKDWYVSSTQRSADTAYNMAFEDGWLNPSVKGLERLARPVRRFLR